MAPETFHPRGAADLAERLTGVLVPDYRWPVLHATLHRLGGGGGILGGLRLVEGGDQAACRHFVEAVTVPETYLFRHAGHFRILHDLAVERRRHGLTTAVLSAGCSSGEEAWSAAAVLASIGAVGGSRHRVVGWDLCEERLQRARRGRYSSWSVRNGLLGSARFFRMLDDGVEVADELRPLVQFEAVNLVQDDLQPGSRFDAIMVRNVAIYWRDATCRRVLTALTSLLSPDGLLLVGPSDPVELPGDRWQARIEHRGRVYHRRTTRRSSATEDPPTITAAEPAARPRPAPAPAPARDVPFTTRAPRRVAPAPDHGEDVGSASSSQAPDPVERASVLDTVQLLADRGRYREALALMGAEHEEPTLGERLWRGILHLALDDNQEAVRRFRQCVYLSPSDPDHRRWLAAAYEAAGHGDAADRELRNAERLEGP